MRFGWVIARGGAVGGLVLVALLSGGVVACAESSASGGGPGSGGSGAGGSCLGTPQPNVLVLVRSADAGALPDDTTILADWSGGQAGPWVLGDPKTWQSLEISNLICDVDRAHPPASLKELHCEAWTTGPTRIRVNALGFPPFDQTLAPSVAPCSPPARVTVELERPDGG